MPSPWSEDHFSLFLYHCISLPTKYNTWRTIDDTKVSKPKAPAPAHVLFPNSRPPNINQTEEFFCWKSPGQLPSDGRNIAMYKSPG